MKVWELELSAEVTVRSNASSDQIREIDSQRSKQADKRINIIIL
jgi:hypothetical protein